MHVYACVWYKLTGVHCLLSPVGGLLYPIYAASKWQKALKLAPVIIDNSLYCENANCTHTCNRSLVFQVARLQWMASLIMYVLVMACYAKSNAIA